MKPFFDNGKLAYGISINEEEEKKKKKEKKERRERLGCKPETAKNDKCRQARPGDR